MIGTKVNIKAYQSKGKIKKQFRGFSTEEILLTHYDELKGSYKKIAKKFFKENIHSENGFSGLEIEEAIQEYLFEVKANVPFPGPEKEDFTFIDLFAGIGGFRMALQNLGGKCVFSSEWDKYAQQTYRANFGDIPFGDITKKEVKNCIPKEFDLLCGGFPCQPFSIAGVTKKNALGRKHGFEDEKQGNLFFHIAEIIKSHRPRAFFLENVKNLTSHDKGNTFKIIRETLLDLDYSFHTKILDGQNFVPQHRQRTFMIGFDSKIYKGKEKFEFPKMPEKRIYELKEIIGDKVDKKYTLTDHLWNYLFEYAIKHKAKGNGFGYGLFDKNKDKVTRTISARYYKDGAEVLIKQKNKAPRRLTPEECAKLQGYPGNFRIPVSDHQAYKQFGNSVVVPLIEAIGEKIIDAL